MTKHIKQQKRTLSLHLFILVSIASVFVSFSYNDEKRNIDVENFAGSYDVAQRSEDGVTTNYTIAFTKSQPGKTNIEIANFGDVMYVPIKGFVEGNKISIPNQTFVGDTMTLVISGSGKLVGDELVFSYTIDTGDTIMRDYRCHAKRQ